MKTMTTTQFKVTGMTCGHCEMSVREEVQEVPGVDSVEVSHQSGQLTVTSAGPVDEAAVVAAVQEAGYQVVTSA
jgi:copper chaperone